MKKNRRSIIEVLFRCLRLRCPACGQSSIVRRPFHIKHHCPACYSLFKREDGFFVGAIMVNLVVTEGVILATYIIFLLVNGSNYHALLNALFALALLLPVVFYHHTWSVWLSFDYLMESLPKVPQTRL